MMSELKMELKGEGLKNEVAMPRGARIKTVDKCNQVPDRFLGCDSVGQHFYMLLIQHTQ